MLPRAGRSGGVLTRRSLACSLVDVENEPSPAPYRVFWFTWCERFKPDYLNGLVCSHFNTWNSAQHYTRSCWRSTVQTFSSQCEPLCGSRRSTVLSTVWRMRTLLRQKNKPTWQRQVVEKWYKCRLSEGSCCSASAGQWIQQLERPLWRQNTNHSAQEDTARPVSMATLTENSACVQVCANGLNTFTLVKYTISMTPGVVFALVLQPKW